MTENIIKIEPYKLYPLTSVLALDPATLRKAIEIMKKKEDFVSIKVINYKGNWCVYDGIYAMLAANILKEEQITVQIMSRESIPFWREDCNVEETMNNIGISGLYDFEAIGNFKYENYPKEYVGK